MNGVLVGVDESVTAQHALRWAVSYADDHQLPVTALMAWDYINQHHLDPDQGFDAGYSEAEAESVIDGLVERAVGPDHKVERQVVLDHAWPALIRASEGADLLVVGARGLGGFRGLLLGSVSRHVLHAATCPVAVVRHVDHHPDGPIVVGVNGSAASQRALRWAVEHARATKRGVIAVYAWDPPMLGPPLVPPVPDWGAAHAEAEHFLHAQLGRVDSADLTVPIDARTIQGRASAELLSLADGMASMVVVGARGNQSVLGALLGSVADQVAHHATCPVIIVP